MDEKARYERASKRVAELKDFYQHLVTYLVVNVFLFFINILTSPGYRWHLWVLVGWGIAVAIHAASVFYDGLWGGAWQERKIKELMEKEDRARRS